MLATIAALTLANSGAAEWYSSLRDTKLGADLSVPWSHTPFHLGLGIGHWASDGLLTIFFFLAGLELKHELVDGALRERKKAVVPVVAAMGGAALPALLFTAITVFGPEGATVGWAIPTATDIAFAVAILALLGSHLPLALRTFLLTLAIVDDVIAIIIIAVFYSSHLQIGYLLVALLPIALFALVVQRWRGPIGRHLGPSWLVLGPIAALTWALFLNAGIHATIAGVVLAFMVPARGPGNGAMSLAEAFEHQLRPISNGFAVPIFAFFSAGVVVGGWGGLVSTFTEPVTIAVVVGLVIGKLVGITGTTWLVTRLPGVYLDRTLQWADMMGVAALGGIGFTVSLLVSELSFGAESHLTADAKVGVLLASVLAAIVGAVILSIRNRHHRIIDMQQRRAALRDRVRTRRARSADAPAPEALGRGTAVPASTLGFGQSTRISERVSATMPEPGEPRDH